MEYQENLQKKREVALRTSENAIGLLDISRDCILPDSYADIKRILAVSASLVPQSGYVEGGKASTKRKDLFSFSQGTFRACLRRPSE